MNKKSLPSNLSMKEEFGHGYSDRVTRVASDIAPVDEFIAYFGCQAPEFALWHVTVAFDES
jgi:hypothetical protein